MIEVNLFIPEKITVEPQKIEGYNGAYLRFHLRNTTSQSKVTVVISESQVSDLKVKLQEIIDQI